MKLFQKIDTYLLEKLPLLWHNKVLYTLVYSTLLSILYFAWGYFYTSPLNIKHLSITDFLYRSDAFLCLIILNACFLILWSLSFFRKNAVKNFYPLQRFYFTRLFCSFVLIFWSITWPVNTFNWGVNNKVREIAPVITLEKHLETINFANAFLFENDYSFENYIHTHYPDIRILAFDNNTQKWEEGNYELDTETQKEWKTTSLNYIPAQHPENNDTIGNRLLQFIEVKDVSNNNKCNPTNRTLFVKAHALKDICPNELFDLRNYSNIEIDSNYFDYPEYSSIFQQYADKNRYRYKYYYADPSTDKNLPTYRIFNKKIASFIESANVSDVMKLLNTYQKLLIQLRINHSLNTEEIANYVMKRTQEMTFKPIVASSFNDENLALSDIKHYKTLEAYQEMRSQKTTYTQPLYFVEKSQLREVYSNSQKAHDPLWNWDYLIVSSYFALSLAFIVFLFAINQALNVVIAAAISGVLAILNTLFFVVFLQSYKYYESIDFRLFSQLLIFSAILFSLLYFFYKSKKINKRIILILFNLCFGLICFIPLFLMQFLESILKYKVEDECLNSHTVHSVFYYWSSDPILNLVFVFGSIIAFTICIKPILSKPE